ncbi:dephospho-CoA kinase [Pseudopedobacter beijingensis]|uniref:Dephospho-CoA kinase n=1 Tax=Pseudopedobacter beijingensis TaxID=1207056 RepID=A0ABW4IF34_9SPHI
MIKVGITGGIGTGKTTVSKIFALLGVPVYNADIEAKRLMHDSNEIREKLLSAFGEEAYTPDQKLNNKYIAQIVFNNPDKLRQLNETVHPVVINDFVEWSNRQNTFYVLKEAALLFESKSYLENDYNLLVSAPVETRIARVMKRDGVSREEVLARINKQMPEEQKEQLADYIIKNDETEFLINQVLNIHENILKGIDGKK